MANKLPSVENIKETVYSYLDDYDDFSIEGVDMNDRDQFDEYFLNQVCLDLIDDYAPELDAYSEEWDEYYKEVEKEVVKYLKSKGVNTFDFGESVKFKKGQPLSEGTSNFSSSDNFPLLVFYTYDEVYDLLSDDSNYPDEDDFTDEEGEVDWDAYEDAKEAFEEKFFDELDACVLTEEDVENLEEDIDNFNGDTKSIAYEIYDKDYEDADDDYYTLKDIAVKIESGYYAAAQIDVENEDEFQYLSEKLKNEQLERFKNFFKELKDKYNLTELTVAYRFSNGETGYSKVENLKEDLNKTKKTTKKLKEDFNKESATLLDLFKNKNKYIVEEKLNEDFYLYIEALTENGEAIYQDRFDANNIKNVLVEICDAETGSYTGESVYPVAITDKLSDVKKEALEELGIESLEESKIDVEYDRRAVEKEYNLEDGELDGVSIRDAEALVGEETGALDRFIKSKNEAIEGTPKESDYKKNAKKHKASNKKGARGNNDGFGRAVNTNPQRNQEIFNHMMGTDGGAEGASCEGGACGESLDEAYIYLFPDVPAMGDYKNECKKFGLKFLGKNYFEDEKNLVIKGSKANLKKYADFLDYDLHPDYLYDENDFAGDIEESCSKSKKLKEDYLDDDYKAIATSLSNGWYHGTTYDGRKWGLSINGGDGEQFSPLFADAVAREVAFCVEDGNLSYDGLECILYKDNLEDIDEEQLAKDLETVGADINDFDEDGAITFYIDYEIDLDEYEDDEYDESLKEEHIVKPDAVFFNENNTAFWNGCKIEREKIDDEDDDDYWDYKVYDKAGVFKYSSDDLEKAINYINKWEESLEKGKSKDLKEARDDDRVAHYQEELDELGATEEECNKYIKIADDYEAKCDRHFITYDQMKEVADAMGLKEMSDAELARAWDVCYCTLSREAFKEDDSEDLERYHKYSDAASAFSEVINQEARERKAKGNYSPRKGEPLNLESIIGDDFFVDSDGLAYISEKKIKEIVANAKDVGMSFDDLMNQTFSGEKDGRFGSLRLSEYKGTFKKFWDNNESLKEEVLKEDATSDELKKYIANGGITLDASTSKPVDYDKGYQVAFEGTEERFPKDEEENILNALNKKINDKKHPFVGLWIENDEEACLDYSEYVEDFKEAVKRAIERNQVAIFDWSIKDSIYVKDIVK